MVDEERVRSGGISRVHDAVEARRRGDADGDIAGDCDVSVDALRQAE
jgi:hypothetical protein